MKKKMDLIVAPTAIQPGDYVKEAYADQTEPHTPTANVEILQGDSGWQLTLSWDCPEPINDASDDTNVFVDSAAFMAPGTLDANWVTMGAPDKPVEAVLWRADRATPLRVVAEGMGTVERHEPPKGWSVSSGWQDGRWEITFNIADWPALAAHEKFAIAVWRGAAKDRAGLKSISPGWFPIKA
jgi:DMSO reductase family type II enzyme heme b subunit